jgi:lysophospholipase L1-like esterase
MERTLDRVVTIVAAIRRTNPSAHIALLGLYDPYRIADLFRLPRLSPIDHFHPSAEGYELIAARVKQAW